MAQIIDYTECLTVEHNHMWQIEQHQTCTYNYKMDYSTQTIADLNYKKPEIQVQEYWLSIINFIMIVFLFILPYGCLIYFLNKIWKKWEIQTKK